MTILISKLISQRRIAPRSAEAKVSILKPATNRETNNKSAALTTKEKSPKVKMFIGRVRRVMIGLITAFMIPKTTATINAVVKLAT